MHGNVGQLLKITQVQSCPVIAHFSRHIPRLGDGLSRVRGAETLSGVHLIKTRKTKSKNVKADKDETLMEEVKRITSEIAQRLAHQAAETPPQVVAATAITNLHTWPTTFDEAKGLFLLI